MAQTQELAARLLQARRTHTLIDPASLSACKPENADEAYVVQRLVLDELGGCAGYKIGAGTPTAADLGLGDAAGNTPRCAIGVSGNWNAASGQKIVCTLKGNPDVIGKTLTLERTTGGQWPCTSGNGLAAQHRPNGCA